MSLPASRRWGWSPGIFVSRSCLRTTTLMRRGSPSAHHLRPMRPHDARSLGREVEVAFPFHPLFRQRVIVTAGQLHDGSRHLTLRGADDRTFLVAAWMIDPEAASIKIVDVPCQSLARLVELRAFLDSGLGSGPGRDGPEGGGNGEASEQRATGSVRGAAAGRATGAGRTSEGLGAAPGASDRSDGDANGPDGDGR